MITVGTDTYLTLTDADIYLSKYHVSTETNMIAWAALTDANCEALLRKAAQIIDRQPISGVKCTSAQVMQFPRVVHAEWPIYSDVNYVFWDVNLYIQPVVPTAVMDAQCEIALALTVGESERVTLQRQGVKSYSIGNLSETLSGAGQMARIPSLEAIELLRPYITGTVRIT